MNQIKSFTENTELRFRETNEFVFVDQSLKMSKNALKGVWYSTVENIDFQQVKNKKDVLKQLKTLFKVLHKNHFNNVFFQVRPMNDAFYNSRLSPQSRFITGKEGEDLGIDILKEAIIEAKKYNILVHAWINPYRVYNKDITKLNLTKDEYLNSLSELSFARKNKDLVLETTKHSLIFDPSSKRVQAFICDVCLELLENYEIASVHMDDYFYPYEEIIDPFEEKKRDALYPELSISDFRRQNVTDLISLIYTKIKEAGKNFQFGISPFGIWDTHSSCFKENQKGSPEGSFNDEKVFTCYHGLYADVLLWMKKGIIDYVVPQIYFAFDNYREKDGQKIRLVTYHDLVDWWAKKAILTNTKLYIGQALYLVGSNKEWENSDELINQMLFNLNYQNIKGSVFFTFNQLTSKTSLLKEVVLKIKKFYENRFN